jgi:predicted PurR-regulated permease PerM
VVLSVTGVAASLALLYAFRTVLWPFVLALVFAVLVNALLRGIGHSWPRAGRVTVLTLATFVIGTSALLSMIVLVKGVTDVAGQTPQLIQRLDDLLDLASRLAGLETPLSLKTLITSIDLPALAARVLAGVRHALSGMVLTLLYLVFILASQHRIADRAKLALSGERPARMLALADRTIRGVETYVWIQAVTGLMIAVASGVVMLAVGLQNAIFWSLALFMLSFIPIIGVGVGSIAPALFALLQFPTLWQAAAIFAGVQAVSFVVGNFILPTMQAKSQNIDPLTSLLAVAVWSVLWGLPGAFLAIPLTLALMFQLSQFESLRWLAIMMSNDGHRLTQFATADEDPGSS